MDLEGEKLSSALESVEDNEEITDKTRNLGNSGESKFQNSGSSIVANNDNEFFPEVEQKGAEVTVYVNSSPVSPSPATTRRGYGLKKWRRIRRDANRSGDNHNSIDIGLMGTHELSNPVVTPSKRMQYAARKQKSEGSISSTEAVVRRLDGFALLDDSGLGFSQPFSAETDSENSSKSSTAASAPKMKYNKSSVKSSSVKNITHTEQHGKKARGGERVKIEKEDSHSSLESDSRSSNFVFMQGNDSTDNGIQSERPKGYDQEEEEDEVQGSGHGEVSYGEGAREEFSPEDGVADSSSGNKEERSESHGSLRDQDSLGESFLAAFDCAKEALEKELQKFKEMGRDVPVDDSISDLCTEFIDIERKLQPTSSGQLPPGEGEQQGSRGVQSEVVETENRDLEAEEIEELFKKKIEIELEYIVLSRSAKKLRAAATVDQITVLEEQASEQNQILDKLEHAENKATVLKKEAEKLERICEDIASADETLKLQNKVCKYSSCFFVQLVMLVVTLGVFVFQLSPDYVEVVPT